MTETEDNTDMTEAGLDMKKKLGQVILEETLGIMVDKIVEESIETTVEMTVMTETGTGLEKGHLPEIMAIIEVEVKATVDPGQDPELAQIGIEFIVISVRNMIISQGTVLHLGKKWRLPASTMLNLGNEQVIKPPASNTQAEFSRVHSEENLTANQLNL